MFFTEVEKLRIWSQGKRIGSETIKVFIHTRPLEKNEEE